MMEKQKMMEQSDMAQMYAMDKAAEKLGCDYAYYGDEGFLYVLEAAIERYGSVKALYNNEPAKITEPRVKERADVLKEKLKEVHAKGDICNVTNEQIDLYACYYYGE